MNTIEIKKENVIAAFNQADAATKKVLTALFGNVAGSEKITDRVKTFEDALKIAPVSENMKILLDYNGNDDDLLSSQAYAKLTIIAKALNEGWVPDWNNQNQYKYIPWFKEKSGFGLSYLGVGTWYTHTDVGSRLCYKSEELAKYAATQFADIYRDYLTIKK